MIPREFKEHLKHREGYRDEVYLDTLGKPTCGVGHLLTEQECRQYDVGERVPQHVIDRWLEQDTEVAWQAALMQSQDLGIDSFEFTVALGSVNFQVGTSWMNKFPSAYRALQNRDYNEAIRQVSTGSGRNGQSRWMEQTPVRVRDFVEAIDNLT